MPCSEKQKLLYIIVLVKDYHNIAKKKKEKKGMKSYNHSLSLHVQALTNPVSAKTSAAAL